MNNLTYQPKYPVQTVSKALDILYYLKSNVGTEGISISELSEQLSLGKSNVHRILDTLLAYEFVEKTNDTSYKLGWGIFEFSHAVLKQHALDPVTYAPLLDQLCREFSETVNLGFTSKNESVTLYKSEPNQRIRANVQVGAREPLYCTSLGKLFLSQLTDEMLKEYFEMTPITQYTPNTITSYDALVSELNQIRAQGFSRDNEELCAGMICIGAPIRDYTGKIAYAVSLSGPSERMTEEKQQKILPKLKEVCASLSSFLGYSGKM